MNHDLVYLNGMVFTGCPRQVTVDGQAVRYRRKGGARMRCTVWDGSIDVWNQQNLT